MDKLGERILFLRKSIRMSQKELAKIVGITEATLSRYENNLREPKAEIINRIAKALNTSSDYLLCNTDNSLPVSSENTTAINLDNLPEEAIKEINNYINYVKLKYNT